MTAAVCSWCDRASLYADLVGFIGALILALPFLFGQKLRDMLLLLSRLDIPDGEDARIFREEANRIRAEFATGLPREYRFAWIGATLIALAFLGRFTAGLFS